MLPFDFERFCTTVLAIERTGEMAAVVLEGMDDEGRDREKTENWGASCSRRTWARVPNSQLEN